jgi:4-hydroxy-2-oxoheptanedioate aldolase
MGHLGADWLLIDCEHGAASQDNVLPLLQACAMSPATAVVRLPSSERALLGRVLDMGAEGVLVPCVRSRSEVEAVVGACRYPPAGIRGIGPLRASAYYREFLPYWQRANEEVLVAVQIETREAVADLDSILSVRGLDAVFVGPADLAAAYGQFPDTGSDAMERLVEEIAARAKRAGVPAGFYCGSGNEARRRASQGFNMVSVGIDLGALTRGLERELERARVSD